VRLGRRGRYILTGAGALAAFLLLAVAGNSLAHYQGWSVHRMAPEALAAKLRPWYRVTKPEGAGRFPTALLYSGCDGPKDNLDRWAATLNARGWAAIIVDSHGPRGFSEYDVWRLICAGQMFMGSERAGDVLVSVADARRLAFVDPDRIVLMGSSHGGWAIMDLLALDPPRRLPFNLAALPDEPGGDPLAGVIGTVLLYPYCGTANRAARRGWRRPVPTLFVLGEDDAIADPDACLRAAERLEARGVPVETLMLAGVTHGFDQEDRAALSTLEFDERATATALERGMDFLDGLGETSPNVP
jgi:dienelactone hydrolase